MNEGTAIEIAESMMKEFGVGKDYIIRYRHLRLDSKEKKELKAENNLFIHIDLGLELKIESKSGIYNMSDEGINEQQHVHRGLIKLENLSKKQIDAKFIQVIPLHKNNGKRDKELND